MTNRTTRLIAVRDQFELHRLLDRGDDNYQEYKLVLTARQAPKHDWFLSWHIQDQRLIANRDALLLHNHHPEIHAWLIAELVEHAATAAAVDNISAANITAIAADTSSTIAPISAPVSARDKAIAEAIEAGNRWDEAQRAKRRADEEQRQREADTNFNWRQSQLTGFMISLATPGLDHLTGRRKTIWDDLPLPPRLFR